MKKEKIFFNFLNKLAKDLNNFFKNNIKNTFQIKNKHKGKAGYDPVTNLDRKCEKFIKSKILKKFPDHKIIGEEFGVKNSKSDFSWVIDPIDGTRSFIVGNPTWSNLVSINYKGSPIMGLANFPELKKYYINRNSKQAYVFHNKKRKLIKVNKNTRFKDIKLAAAFHGALSINKQKKITKFLKLMQYPCFDALTYAQLAEGKVDVVVQCANKIWDVHALIPIIKAAGGVITTWSNGNAIKAGNIISSNNEFNHKKILKLLKPAIR